jgi:hypothetical protein
MLLALSGMLIGALLGMRFTVLALVPIIACAFVIAGAGWLAGTGTFGSTALEFISFVACLQLGYLGSAAFRLAFARMGAARGDRHEALAPKQRAS